MKTLSAKDLPKSDALKLFELGYEAGNCQNQEDFKRLLVNLQQVLPIDSVICGFGALEGEGSISNVWADMKLPPFKIHQIVCDTTYPTQFMDFYLENDVLLRDCQFYECLRTQKPQLWMDLYRRNKHPFDPRTKRGFNADYAERALDSNLPFVLRLTPIDIGTLQVTNFSLTFRKEEEAYQFSEIFHSVTYYLHAALLRVYRQRNYIPPYSILQAISLREREVLRWIIEGKSNGEIGMILHVSDRTVKFHLHNLMRKFSATNRYQLVAQAYGITGE